MNQNCQILVQQLWHFTFRVGIYIHKNQLVGYKWHLVVASLLLGLVWKLSRLARSLTQVIKTASDIHERGIGLKVLTQNIDTTTPEGRLFFHMTAAFDEFQRELIVENTRAGLAAANKRGRRGGRPKGMDMDEEGMRKAEAMLKDIENYPFVGDVIDQLKIGRTAFYRYFPPDRIKELRREHSEMEVQ